MYDILPFNHKNVKLLHKKKPIQELRLFAGLMDRLKTSRISTEIIIVKLELHACCEVKQHDKVTFAMGSYRYIFT